MSKALAAVLPYTPPGLARALLADPILTPLVEQFAAAVLFADISGFTPLTEALAQSGAEGPEEMTRLLNAYFSRLIAAIEAEGGEVVKFSGDAMTALFPAKAEPAGHAARRAAQAAAAMHAFTGDFAAVQTSVGPIALSVKIGIGVGTVHAFRVGGILERWEYVVAGEPLRQVAEAEHAAKSGETILSPETAAVLANPATPLTLPSRQLIAPHIDACTDPQAAATALRCFVPGALRAWLGEEVQEWLAALRPMSVLFIGVSGLDYAAPNALARLQAFLTSAQEVIYRFEGSVNKLVVDDKGTVLLAMLGAPPLAHADDAVRAAQAARDLLAMAATQGLAMAVGVATGPVFAGPVGSATRREYTVMGDTVNRAARLMAVAGPGDIRCDLATVRDARRTMEFDTLPPVHLKGKSGLAEVYRPVGPARSLKQASTLLAGRLGELARLEAAITDIQAGQQRLLLIEGEAGMGKSRLVAELTRLCRARDLPVLAGAGHSSERQKPFHAWRDVFSAYFAFSDVAVPAERRRLVQALVAEIAPGLVERLPLLNELLGTEFPETALTAPLQTERRHYAREALLIELLGLWAAERPLVLLLEDVQRMDPGSWELTLAVARGVRAANFPVLMVLTRRPIKRLDRPAPLTELEAFDCAENIKLAGLDQAEIVALSAGGLGLPASEIPTALANLICARAGGNPSFAEEILLSLLDQGLLEIAVGPDQRHCVMHGDLEEGCRHLPETIRGVILSRIDRLHPAAQMLLRVGSVIGHSFPFSALHAALMPYMSTGETDLKSQLEDLADLHLILRHETAGSDLRHAFKHDTTRDVAYGTLLFTQRRELHQGMAKWYESLQSPGGESEDPGENSAAPRLPWTELVHLLAYHHRQAGNAERECYYATLAGELAVAGFANAEALVYLNRALELTPVDDRSNRRRLLLSREQVYDVCADRAAQAADLEMMSELSDPHDVRAQAELALRLANYHRVTDDFPNAVEAGEQAANLALAAGWEEGEIIARHIRGAALIPLGRYDEAREQLGQALQRASAAGLAGTEDDCLRDLGQIAFHQGDYLTARGYYDRALAIDRAIGDRRGQSTTLVRLGAVSHALGENDAAQACYKQAVDLARATGDRDSEGDAVRGLGVVDFEQGDYTAAQEAYTESLAIERTTGDREGEAACLAALGMVARALGDLTAAQDALVQALAINQAIGDRHSEAAVRADLALLCHQLGDHQTARDHAQASRELARSIGAPAIERTALTRLGQALEALGDHRGAEAVCQEALELDRDEEC